MKKIILTITLILSIISATALTSYAKSLKEFFKACSDGDIAAVQKFIDSGDANSAGENGDRAIFFAAAKGQIKILELLCQNGADVNAQNNEGWTALMSAAAAGKIEPARFLLDKGANPDLTAVLKNAGKRTARSIAILKKNDEIVKLIDSRSNSKSNTEPGPNNQNPYLNDSMCGQSINFKGTEWNNDEETSDGKKIKFTGKKIKSEDNDEYELSAVLTIKKLFQNEDGTAYHFHFNFKSELATTLTHSEQYYFATPDKIYRIGYYEKKEMKKIIMSKKLPQKPGQEELVCVSDGKIKFENMPWITTIEQADSKCAFNSWHDGSGHFSKIVWSKNKGITEYAFGYGAHRYGARLERK